MNLLGVSLFFENTRKDFQSNLVLVVFFFVKVSIAYRGRMKAEGGRERKYLYVSTIISLLLKIESEREPRTANKILVPITNDFENCRPTPLSFYQNRYIPLSLGARSKQMDAITVSKDLLPFTRFIEHNHFSDEEMNYVFIAVGRWSSSNHWYYCSVDSSNSTSFSFFQTSSRWKKVINPKP